MANNLNGTNTTRESNMASSGLLICFNLIELFKGQGTCAECQKSGTSCNCFAYDVTSFAVECVNEEGMTVWLADFFAEELEFLKEFTVEPKAGE